MAQICAVSFIQHSILECKKEKKRKLTLSCKTVFMMLFSKMTYGTSKYRNDIHSRLVNPLFQHICGPRRLYDKDAPVLLKTLSFLCQSQHRIQTSSFHSIGSLNSDLTVITTSDLKGNKLKAAEKMHMRFDVCSKHLSACLRQVHFLQRKSCFGVIHSQSVLS